MPIVEHSELVLRALHFIHEQQLLRPDTPLMTLIDEAGLCYNLSPLDAMQFLRALSPSIQNHSS